jgi:hypothetical protein
MGLAAARCFQDAQPEPAVQLVPEEAVLHEGVSHRGLVDSAAAIEGTGGTSDDGGAVDQGGGAGSVGEMAGQSLKAKSLSAAAITIQDRK